MNRVTIVIIATLAILFAAISVVIAIARGYQFDFTRKSLLPTGILVATSDPDGAEVFINDKLQTATNNTINLAPGRYKVEIKKDGFFSWQKTIEIKKEEVFKTNVFLFPSVPDLRPLTLTGALNPAASPDNARIVYGVASASASKNGVWVVDISKNFTPASIFSGANFRQIYRDVPSLALSSAKFLWSPDSQEVIASTSSGLAVLLGTDRANEQLNFVTNTLDVVFSQWKEQEDLRTKTQRSKLNAQLAGLLATTAANLRFSPDETKVLYQATSSASLPSYLSTYLPGTNPTPQNRHITPGNIYVYDTKEDRNYLVQGAENRDQGTEKKLTPVPCALCPQVSWFPSGRHLLSYTNQEISVSEFDGTNKAPIFSGPFRPGVILPWPNWSKIVILTSLNSVPGTLENLYTINLR